MTQPPNSNLPEVERTCDWQKTADWTPHTLSRAEADRIVSGYLALIEAAAPGALRPGCTGLGIGSGAGNVESAFAVRGFTMTASEWSDDGLGLIETHNPGLARRKVDLRSISDRNAWDLIVCRELYPFTREANYDEQMRILRSLVAALKPGGVLLVVGSDVAKPSCMDYARAFAALRADADVAEVYGPVLEAFAKRAGGRGISRVGYRIGSGVTEVALRALQTARGSVVAAIRIYAIRKMSEAA